RAWAYSVSMLSLQPLRVRIIARWTGQFEWSRPSNPRKKWVFNLLQINEGAARRVHQGPATGEVPMTSSDDWRKTVRLNKLLGVGCGKIGDHGPRRRGLFRRPCCRHARS